MRVLLKFTIPTDKGNASIKDGSLPKKLQVILSELKPEAAYFTADGGLRGGVVVIDLKDQSQLPAVAEPFFLAFNATVEALPAMTAEDLMKAGPAIEAAIKKYG